MLVGMISAQLPRQDNNIVLFSNNASLKVVGCTQVKVRLTGENAVNLYEATVVFVPSFFPVS